MLDCTDQLSPMLAEGSLQFRKRRKPTKQSIRAEQSSNRLFEAFLMPQA